jgi:hypothetical protein
MMLIASLIELAIAKTWMWHNHNAQLANFELASLRLSGFVGPAFGLLVVPLSRAHGRGKGLDCKRWHSSGGRVADL